MTHPNFNITSFSKNILFFFNPYIGVPDLPENLFTQESG